MGNELPKEANELESEELFTRDHPIKTELDEKYAFMLNKFPPRGYNVIGIEKESPLDRKGLVAYFDFIVAANNIPLKAIDTTFISLIKVSYNQFSDCIITHSVAIIGFGRETPDTYRF